MSGKPVRRDPPESRLVVSTNTEGLDRVLPARSIPEIPLSPMPNLADIVCYNMKAAWDFRAVGRAFFSRNTGSILSVFGVIGKAFATQIAVLC